MIQIALTLWIAALQLLLQVQNSPNITPELRDQANYAANTAIVYAQGIMNNPPVETKQVAGITINNTTVVPDLQFTKIPTVVDAVTVNDSTLIRYFEFTTNVPATAVFYVDNSPRDIGYSTTTATSFRFGYDFHGFAIINYKIVIKANGLTKTFEDRCDGSRFCFADGRLGDREYTIN